MSKPTSSRVRRVLAAVTGATLVLTGSVALTPAATAATPPEAGRTVALVGSLQSELGCSDDWQPDCAATELTLTETEGVYSAEFEVPAGSYEYKVALDDAWDEAYGLDGGADNIPLTVAGPATLRFTFDDTIDRVGQPPRRLRRRG